MINQNKKGQYTWRYEMSLFKNPTIFLLVWKILICSFAVIFLFVTVIDLRENGTESLLQNGRIFLIIFAVITGITILGYLVYAAIMGGKYIVDFTMDDKGVLHSQAPAQAKKARKLGAVTAIAGAASGKPGFAGIGINSTRTEMYSDFSKVKSVKAYPRRNIIKVNSPFNKNQVYASKEDFDFVLNYIRTHTNK
jgi:hypothetical protein